MRSRGCGCKTFRIPADGKPWLSPKTTTFLLRCEPRRLPSKTLPLTAPRARSLDSKEQAASPSLLIPKNEQISRNNLPASLVSRRPAGNSVDQRLGEMGLSGERSRPIAVEMIGVGVSLARFTAPEGYTATQTVIPRGLPSCLHEGKRRGICFSFALSET